MLLGLSQLSPTSNAFILFATLISVLSTTFLFLGLGYTITTMFRRGTNNSRSSSTTASVNPSVPTPIRKSSWGFATPTSVSSGRVKAAAKEINVTSSVAEPPRKNSIGLASIRGAGGNTSSRPPTPSSSKSTSTHVSTPSKPDHPKQPASSSSLERVKKEMEERVAELTSQIALVKAEVLEKDTKLSDSLQAADKVKEDLANANRQLDEERGKNERLSSEKDTTDSQLIALKTSHEKLRTLYTTTSQSLLNQTTNLETERQKFNDFGLSPSSLQDKLSSDDITTHLHSLNSHIEETASFMVEQFDLASPSSKKTAPDFTSEDMEEAKERAEEILGPRMVQLLLLQSSKSKKSSSGGGGGGDLSSLVRKAFQAGMCAYAEWMVSSWLFEDPGKEGVLNSVYESMRKTEPAPILGLWKSLTHKHGHTTTSITTTDLSIYFLDAIINVLIVSGFHATHMSLHSHITGNYSDKIVRLVQDASRLNRCLGEDIVTHDLEVVHIPPDASYDPAYMDVHHTNANVNANGNGNGNTPMNFVNKLSGKKPGSSPPPPPPSETVLCTLDLGLLRLVKNSTTGKWENRVLAKPKVLLQSGL